MKPTQFLCFVLIATALSSCATPTYAWKLRPGFSKKDANQINTEVAECNMNYITEMQIDSCLYVKGYSYEEVNP